MGRSVSCMCVCAQTYANPLKYNPAYAAVRQYFVEETDVVAKDVVVNMNKPSGGIYFRRAGPREKVLYLCLSVCAPVLSVCLWQE
jgi:6-phosphofructokinase 1